MDVDVESRLYRSQLIVRYKNAPYDISIDTTYFIAVLLTVSTLLPCEVEC